MDLPILVLDKERRFGGTEIGTLKLTEAPYREKLADMPESDVAAEGYPELTKQEFIDRFFDGDSDRRVWVIRFQFMPCDLKTTTAWGEFYWSENCQLWASQSHRQRWDWKNMEVLELEQLGSERLLIPYGRLPLFPDGSRPVVPSGMSVKLARPFLIEEEELQPIEGDSIINNSVPVSSSLNRCEQVSVPLADDSLSSERSSLSESSNRGREKLRELADSLSEEGLRQLVRRLSESLGDDSITEVGQVVIESSFEEKEADLPQEPQKPVCSDSILGTTGQESNSSSLSVKSNVRSHGEPHSDTSSESYSPEPSSQSSASGKSAEPVLSSSSVGVYAPGGEARGGHEYFRLTWWDKGRSRRDPRSGTHHKHIRGGNTSKPSAISRVRKIIDAIPQGSA